MPPNPFSIVRRQGLFRAPRADNVIFYLSLHKISCTQQFVDKFTLRSFALFYQI